MPSQRHRPTARLGMATAVLVLALTSCSSSDGKADDTAKEPPVGNVPALLDSTSLRFPLDVYMPTAQQRGTLNEAQDMLIDQCMKRYGYRFAVRKQGRSSGDNARRYGVSSAAAAERDGYDNPEVNKTEQKPAQQALGPNEKLVLNGKDKVNPSDPVPMSQEEAEQTGKGAITVGGQKVPAGGCLREGYLKLYAPKKDSVDIMVPQNFGFDAYSRSREDSRVRKAIKAWSACMKKHGYTTDDPVSPQDDLGFDDGALGSPKAMTAARQDVSCKRKTNLVGIWFTVETAYQKRLIEQNAETLDSVKKQLDARLRLAAQLTS
ncbi:MULTISPECIES: hypothetical protein [unclassified Streptomyces]|uniref:hypothetical protein n=1 Tax=unclassified Streptomyces TaxID=2593676 RepID=UPI000DAEC9C7|nr:MULTISPECIES: hypothetical protein [unclassified Streptomyces]PZT75951.1 hypothetical protein DNK56_21395 [Streptomyces sp. AC1-42W]PZT80098.1 hypothetical protein DNK55_11290 [Streptomyces sp. AC1-42T]